MRKEKFVADPSRREFLKKMGSVGAGVAGGAVMLTPEAVFSQDYSAMYEKNYKPKISGAKANYYGSRLADEAFEDALYILFIEKFGSKIIAEEILLFRVPSNDTPKLHINTIFFHPLYLSILANGYKNVVYTIFPNFEEKLPFTMRMYYLGILKKRIDYLIFVILDLVNTTKEEAETVFRYYKWNKNKSYTENLMNLANHIKYNKSLYKKLGEFAINKLGDFEPDFGAYLKYNFDYKTGKMKSKYATPHKAEVMQYCFDYLFRFTSEHPFAHSEAKIKRKTYIRIIITKMK